MNLPILNVRLGEGDQALLDHYLTPDEQSLFQAMDSATAELDAGGDLDAYYAVIVPIGEKCGLTREQSIAFWTRTTFMLFEP